MCFLAYVVVLIRLLCNFFKAGVLFKGNLRGQAAKSYEKISKRMKVSFSLSLFLSFSHTSFISLFKLYGCFFVNMCRICLQDKFGDEYKLFLLVNPEDDQPVAVVVPRRTLQPETTGDYLNFHRNCRHQSMLELMVCYNDGFGVNCCSRPRVGCSWCFWIGHIVYLTSSECS